jgi:hypothetical protein
MSLSTFLRNAAESHFEGPIPALERDRIRIVESAERAFDRALPPLERSLRSLTLAYGDVLRDSALVEASRQLLGEAGGAATPHYRRRAEILAESAAWLAEKSGKLAELARRESVETPPARSP